MASPAFRITIDDADVTRLLTSAPPRFATRVRQLIEGAAIDVQREVRIAANVGVTGNLRRSIQYTFSPANLSAVIAPTANYAEDVEYGTPPHLVSAAPGSSLAAWAKQKHINPFALQASIAKKGTKAHPFVAPTYDKMRPKVESDIADGVGALVEELSNA